MAIEDITREDVTREHIESALKYIAQHGRRYEGKRHVAIGIFYLYSSAYSRGIKYEIDGKEDYFAIRETLRIAALYAAGEMPENDKVSKEKINSVPKSFTKSSWNFAKRRGFELYNLKHDVPRKIESDDENLDSDGVADEAVALLKQFRQIILYGPPGTGKTYRAKTAILPHLLGVGEDEVDDEQGRWDIVQFHPSYNYEDFVRGVEVKTEGDNVIYNTVDKIFGDICKRAAKASKEEKHVLIIDEINRANVSAVLGELIYALEYRDEKIKTPYAVGKDGFNLVIPENLYIIGTMNTADRTIGQIDYAVRRRFAFVQCLPDNNVIRDDNARDAFFRVDSIFSKKKGYMSSDYDADDVRIGHSYFLPKPNENLNDKVIYQVVPILREYVKDGILLENAKEEISDIEEEYSVENSGLEIDIDKNSPENDTGNPFYYWEKEGQYGINGVGRTVLSITKDYVNRNRDKSLEEVQAWFPDRGKGSSVRGIKLASKVESLSDPSRFFNKDPLNIDGQIAYVTREWNQKAEKGVAGALVDFIEGVKEKSGYTVSPCYVVKMSEEDKRLSWEMCKKFGFVSAGGLTEKGQSNTKGLKRMNKGDIVFAFLRKSSVGKKGFIGMGRVLGEAVPVNQFKVEGTETFLLDYELEEGQKYRDKYPIFAEDENDEEKCEWMVRVQWMEPFLSRENMDEDAVGGQPVYWVASKKHLGVIKEKFERE